MGLNKKGGGGGFLFGPKEEGGGGSCLGLNKKGGGGGFLFGPKQERGGGGVLVRGRRRTPPTPLSALSGRGPSEPSWLSFGRLEASEASREAFWKPLESPWELLRSLQRRSG